MESGIQEATWISLASKQPPLVTLGSLVSGKEREMEGYKEKNGSSEWNESLELFMSFTKWSKPSEIFPSFSSAWVAQAQL